MGVIFVSGAEGIFERIADAASDYFSLEGGAEAELVFCDEARIRELNASTRGVDKVTDVLSYPLLTLECGRYASFTQSNFPLDTNPESGRVSLGSIVICDSVAKKQAEEYGHGEERERGYLFLHGLLHLLGYDPIKDEDKAAMRKAEEDVLFKAGIEKC